MTEREKELADALEPFAKLADTWTVQTAVQQNMLLTLSNGERMCGIDARAFVRAAAALSRLREGEKE